MARRDLALDRMEGAAGQVAWFASMGADGLVGSQKWLGTRRHGYG